MISYEEVLEIHQLLIQEFGGLPGIRDENGLQSALERPFSGFGGEEFYPTPEEKAAAVIESLLSNHPFLDGNKRTGYVLLRLILMSYGKDIQASQEEKYDFVISVASGNYAFKDVVKWIQQRVVDR
ncbi:death on curing protein [Cyclonatronum proteinivorum]|uniref:Death on curing protein n=1 Tax=Cyclonatronum proteinivorum TaxID=1457365 RepID=A0A345UH76_9BACT|nr:type II toxin-antitoxin system death-on-curing family toxin [Cyclonatronum proteinivorum]AXI99827.1 death on curing protein [Cyclonatronum proteinivorum]